ncbi:MAG: dTDP-4-dehydrorhamnose 3,5-epimerase [Planctomycetota bacterium]|nr:dTDP-4-dehydrorhamnose 3,5-epimerase [Planctomycetota bacterium]
MQAFICVQDYPSEANPIMNTIETALPGVLILEPRVFRDARGYFLETWNQARYAELGMPEKFVQDNMSFSARGVLRGLHYQHPHGQGKLVSVIQGEVFDVAVDIRIGSPSFGEWVGVTLSDENHRSLYIPPGFAHGFVVLSATALFSYKCTEYYAPTCEASLIWNDPDLAIAWPESTPDLSPKDLAAPRLRDVPRDRLPSFSGANTRFEPGHKADVSRPTSFKTSVTSSP